jgi:hypothetical protein
MYTNPKMKYKGNLTRGRQRWIEIYKGRWLLMKGCSKFWSRPRESNLSIMIMSSKKIMNLKNNIICFM